MDINYSTNSRSTVDILNADLQSKRSNNGIQDPTKSKDANDASMNFDMFLKLLTVQLQNQDPLDPMDGTAFTEQIATFSALEQQIATNKNLEKLVQNQDYGAQTLAVSYIGKEALAVGEVVKISAEGQGVDFAYNLEIQSATAILEIVNDSGDTVKIMEGTSYAGLNQMTWDGKDTAGQPVPAGDYKVIVKALDVKGEKVDNTMYSYGYVKAVEVEGNSLNLVFSDGRQQSFDAVLSIREQDTNS